ncbi:hypothetical protein J3R30DRAFT_3742027 [Lentinula aciculospora]|uniref:Uncharacterized protein n=1 Tax=Lentinula aciculospora TaxID=153920 RepID=A0A9W8ZT51_9AGAR|nr:hypothetical protein J3R30DRAFT_3742027 [Lentinula aciculospora]
MMQTPTPIEDNDEMALWLFLENAQKEMEARVKKMRADLAEKRAREAEEKRKIKEQAKKEAKEARWIQVAAEGAAEGGGEYQEGKGDCNLEEAETSRGSECGKWVESKKKEGIGLLNPFHSLPPACDVLGGINFVSHNGMLQMQLLAIGATWHSKAACSWGGRRDHEITELGTDVQELEGQNCEILQILREDQGKGKLDRKGKGKDPNLTLEGDADEEGEGEQVK